MIAALALTVGIVVVLASWWADAIEDQARLREQPDLTPLLPVAICKPTAWRRRG